MGRRLLWACAWLAAGLAAAAEPGLNPPPAAEAPPPKAGRLTLEALDGRSGKPTPARARVTGAGREFVPDGAVAAGGCFLLDGAAELELPAGAYRVEIDGGARRLPYEAAVTVGPGRTEKRSVLLVEPKELAFERAGWYAADPACSGGALGPEKALRAARAMGLEAVGLDGLAPADRRPPRWAGGFPLLGWSFEPDPRYGSRCRLWAPGGAELRFYADCAAPRRVNPWKTAVPWRPEWAGFYGPMTEATAGLAPRMYFELAAGGDVGGFELDGSAAAEQLWFAILREGYRVPAVAASRGTLSAGQWPRQRMLLRVAGKPEPAALLAAIRNGRSSVSFGPFCFLTVDGRGPGEVLPLVEGRRTVRVRALASTERRAEIARLELYRNGRLFKSFPGAPGQVALEASLELDQDEPMWLVARCGQRIRPTLELAPIQGPPPPETVAITNPVWIDPTAYRITPRPAVTALKLKITDARTGRPVPAALRAGGLLRACPEGRFSGEVSALGPVIVEADGFEPERLDLLGELGLTPYARRLAARTPEEALEELSRPGTFEMLRALLARGELTVELRPAPETGK